MARKKTALSLSAMDNIFKRVGAKRVADTGKKALRKVLEDYAEKICTKAIRLAKHGGRTTVKDEDVELALK